MYNWFSILLVSVFVSGCALFTPKVEYKYVAITPPDSLLVDCDFAAPPQKVDYFAEKNWSEREKQWVNYSIAAITATRDCNKEKEELRKWKQEKIKLWGDQNGNVGDNKTTQGK